MTNPLLRLTEPTLPPARGERGPAAWLLGAWATLALLSAGPTWLHYRSIGLPVPWDRLSSEVLGWLLWLPFFPLIFAAARRFPVGRGLGLAPLGAHLLIGSAVSILYGLAAFGASQWLLALGSGDSRPTLAAAWSGFVFGGFQLYFLVYGLIAAAAHALDYRRAAADRKLEAARLAGELSRAQLEVLKMQLNPHFFFNALNAVSELVHSDPRAAEEMLVRLGELLRRSLQLAGSQEVTLATELALLAQYVEIERVRFGGRLAVDVDSPADLAAARVPAFVLQPLVENAIYHGMQAGRALHVTVRARETASGRLALTVEDDGGGLVEPLHEGVGLANTRARLAGLYGTEQSLELAPRAVGGAVSRLTLPWRPSPVIGGVR